MSEEKQYKLDVEGYDSVTDALRSLFDSFPGLAEGEKFLFSQLPETGGKALFTNTGATVYSETESITGHFTQMCQYPLTVIYRSAGLSEKRKVQAKEWLDTLGRWLERQTVTIDGVEHKLKEYPVLQGDRLMKQISRQTPAYLSQVYPDESEDWIMDIVARYRNEFDT